MQHLTVTQDTVLEAQCNELRTSYMLQKTWSKLERRVDTPLQQPNETVTVELMNLLQIGKDDVLFATQWLWQRGAVHLRNVVINNVLKSANVILFSVDKFLHYQRLSSKHRSQTSTWVKYRVGQKRDHLQEFVTILYNYTMTKIDKMCSSLSGVGKGKGKRGFV